MHRLRNARGSHSWCAAVFERERRDCLVCRKMTRPKVLMSSIGRVAMLGPRVWIRGPSLLRYWSTIAFTVATCHFFAQIYAGRRPLCAGRLGSSPRRPRFIDSADDNDDDGDDPKPWFAITYGCFAASAVSSPASTAPRLSTRPSIKLRSSSSQAVVAVVHARVHAAAGAARFCGEKGSKCGERSSRRERRGIRCCEREMRAIMAPLASRR